MSRRERWAWGALVALLLAAVRLPLHGATAALPVTNDDAIPLMMADRLLHGEPSTILWNQPYNGALDAYLIAPGLLAGSPHGVFRVYEALCGLALVVVAGLLARAVAGERAGWAAALLAACGTPYAALMAALGPTPNFLVPLLVGLVVLAGLRDRGGRPPTPAALALVGLLCGLAVWDSFLAVPALIGAGMGLVAAGVGPRVRSAAWIAAGVALGMAPLLVARLTGASGATPVTALRPRWLWAAGLYDLSRAAAGLFGIDVPLVIDGPERAALPVLAAVVLGLALLALLALGCAAARARPLLGWGMALAAAFALSRRTGGDEIRYLFGLALPVLALCGVGLDTVARRLGPRRGAVAAGLALLAVIAPWTIGHRLLLAAWRDPSHAVRAWEVPPLGRAVDLLARDGIRTAYASLQFAGRLTVESGGAVIASQAWNERIPGDPLRYRDEVDLDPRPAWVLSPSLSRGMPRVAGFRQMLSGMGGTWAEEPAGDVSVFHDFRAPYDEGRPVSAEWIRVTTTDGRTLPPSVLDRHRGTSWTSEAGVARGSGLAISVADGRRLSAIVLLLPRDAGLAGLPWVAEADGAVIARGPGRYGMQWVNGAPRAGRQEVLVVPVGDRSPGEVRILFQDQGPPLTVAEVFAYGPDEPRRPAAGAAAALAAYERFRDGGWREAERLYAEACTLDPERVSLHAAALRAGRRAARIRLDVESLDDGGPALFGPR